MDMNDDIVEAVNRQIQEPPEIDVSDYDEWKADNKTLLRLNVAVLVVSMLSLIVECAVVEAGIHVSPISFFTRSFTSSSISAIRLFCQLIAFAICFAHLISAGSFFSFMYNLHSFVGSIIS